MLRKIISLMLVFSLFSIQPGIAEVAQLNLSGYLSQGPKLSLEMFRSPVLRYFSYDTGADDFQVLLDPGSLKDKLSQEQIKGLAQEQIDYFRVGLSLPNSKFWVNLRPDAPQDIIEPELEQTEVGRIMLESDLQLKKDTALFTSPQTKEGRVYWDKLYKKAGELFGTENITIPTLTRPWIVPGEIILREAEGAASAERARASRSAYVYKATLKVMLEEDYLSQKSKPNSLDPNLQPLTSNYNFSDPRMKELNVYSSQLIRELILPKLTQEVNSGKNYSALRQVYFSLVLSRWFKSRFNGPQSTANSSTALTTSSPQKDQGLTSLIDSGNLTGLSSKEPWSKSTYFKEYQKSFEKG